MDDPFVCGEIEVLMSSIENRQKYLQEIDQVNKLQRQEEIAQPLQIHDVEMAIAIGPQVLQPNTDCRSKSSATASAPQEPAPLLSDQELHEYVQGQKSKNTVKRTKQVIK